MSQICMVCERALHPFESERGNSPAPYAGGRWVFYNETFTSYEDAAEYIRNAPEKFMGIELEYTVVMFHMGVTNVIVEVEEGWGEQPTED